MLESSIQWLLSFCDRGFQLTILNSKGLVAKDFRTRPEALSWIKQYDTPMRIIRQDSI
jgi:hypothetical protein